MLLRSVRQTYPMFGGHCATFIRQHSMPYTFFGWDVKWLFFISENNEIENENNMKLRMNAVKVCIFKKNDQKPKQCICV